MQRFALFYTVNRGLYSKAVNEAQNDNVRASIRNDMSTKSCTIDYSRINCMRYELDLGKNSWAQTEKKRWGGVFVVITCRLICRGRKREREKEREREREREEGGKKKRGERERESARAHTQRVRESERAREKRRE